MPTKQRSSSGRRLLAWLAGAAALLGAVSIGALVTGGSGSGPSKLAGNPNLDPGTPLSGPAPDFTLTDQFGHRISLRSYRGRVVILAFNDSQCTTICPLTTQAMVQAKQLLGPAATNVQLLGIDSNPKATAVSDVRSYSDSHGMLHQWQFLTGSLGQLKQVWRAYHIEVAIQRGQIDHTPALFMIDTRGQLSRLYLTQQSYAAIGQFGQLLAQQASDLMPGHPRVYASRSYAQVSPIGPDAPTTLPGATGSPVRLGGAPQVTFFFATWTAETFPLRTQLAALDRYQAMAGRAGLPRLAAVDEASVEPSAAALPEFLRSLKPSPSFPVVIDQTGRVGDGYQVQDQPWIAVTSATGSILTYYDASTQGPLTTAQLVRSVRAALRSAPKAPASGPALAGSPPPLAGLHSQAGQLLGSESALVSRVSGLRGYAVVLNAWASWCGPCRSEFSLFASSSLRYGRRVGFMGVDTSDSPSDARSFLAAHRVSYPSYQAASTTAFPGLVPQGLSGLPTTIFINRAGKVTYVHTGQYNAQGSLDADIDQYALGG